MDDVFVVTAIAADKTGRTDAATGAVAIGNLTGESLANALMKAETKAKRRVTLSLCGLGMLDESEVETIPDAQVVLDEPVPATPDGFDAWWREFGATAAQGYVALANAWRAASPAFRAYAQQAHAESLTDLKAAAREVAA
ncbi:MAG: hypothetical protein VW405_07335 [Rhodospirillaceae bacterium]